MISFAKLVLKFSAGINSAKGFLGFMPIKWFKNRKLGSSALFWETSAWIVHFWLSPRLENNLNDTLETSVVQME